MDWTFAYAREPWPIPQSAFAFVGKEMISLEKGPLGAENNWKGFLGSAGGRVKVTKGDGRGNAFAWHGPSPSRVPLIRFGG